MLIKQILYVDRIGRSQRLRFFHEELLNGTRNNNTMVRTLETFKWSKLKLSVSSLDSKSNCV